MNLKLCIPKCNKFPHKVFMRYVERTFNIPHEYFFILKVTSQYKRASAFHVVADMLLRYPITASKQTLKRTSFHIQNFGCYENVFAFISKKLQSNFFNVIIIGKENLSRLSHVVLNNMFIDNYN